MTRWRVAAMAVAAMIVGAASAASDARHVQLQTCAESPRRDLLPGVIAPAAGASPAWFVDGSAGQWQGADVWVKSVWILDRSVAGDLRVTGRIRHGTDEAAFKAGMNGVASPSLTILNPIADSMIPGGASEATMRKFAFVSSYVAYPRPGCWELTARLGTRERTIIVAVRQQ